MLMSLRPVGYRQRCETQGSQADEWESDNIGKKSLLHPVSSKSTTIISLIIIEKNQQKAPKSPTIRKFFEEIVTQ